MYNPQIGDLLFNDDRTEYGCGGIGVIVNMTDFDGRRMEECEEIPEPNDRTYYINWLMKEDVTTAYPLICVQDYRERYNILNNSVG